MLTFLFFYYFSDKEKKFNNVKLTKEIRLEKNSSLCLFYG